MSAARGDAGAQRLRVAWMYYSHGLTQQEIAVRLGVSRATIIRLLEEARARGEVRFWIEGADADCAGLAVRLETALGVREVIVVPGGDGPETTAAAVGLALGRRLSDAFADGMTIGVGWGRTLTAALRAFRPPRLAGARVLSLLGGAVEAREANPAEVAWRIAGALGAECYLFPAPLVVDSAATRRALIDACGLDRIYALADRIDAAVVSVGDIGPDCSSLSRGLMSEEELVALSAAGCVADVMCHFLDARGATVHHPIAERVMAVGLDALARAPLRVIASGGAARGPAIRAAVRRIGCDLLVTDDAAAGAILAGAAD